jgi:diguanylate cyclase (GGDEF)-like protein
MIEIFLAIGGLHLGRPELIRHSIEEYFDRVDHIEDQGARVNVLDTISCWAVDVGPNSQIFDTVMARRDAEHILMFTASAFDRIFWHFKAAGRLAQWRHAVANAADVNEISQRRAAARKALSDSRKATRGTGLPVLETKAMLARAMVARLDGHRRKAFRLIARSEQMASDVNYPTIRIEILCERARLLADCGKFSSAEGEVRLALALAASYGLVHVSRTIRNEFPHAAPTSSSNANTSIVSVIDRPVTRVGVVDSQSTSTSLAARRLDALLQVSVAAASVIDPRQLAGVALDEVLKILGAERAFLFLADDEGQVSFFAGRNSDQIDLAEAVGYATTAVEQARVDRQALVVTGSDEGALIGSESAVVHGLRSILVAPLVLEGRLIGVVYLDSRLAKGMFTTSDVDILVAIATQVAVSLETARSAQLEVLVHSEREQRTLVETLRDVMADMTTTLDPGEVLERLLAGLSRAVHFDAASVVILDPDGPPCGRVLAAVGAVKDQDTEDLAPRPDETSVDKLRDGQPVIDPNGKGNPPGAPSDFTVRSWIAVPLQISEDTQATVVVASQTPDAYGDTQLEIVRTVVAHGVIGYQNARLFTANRRLAVTDELSGLDNRRSFFNLASAQLAATRHDNNPLSVLMVDIDHFKNVNDTYGHPTGDDVIKEVAHRLRKVARAEDIVGRYGGEEFVLVLTTTPDIALTIAERLRTTIADQPIQTRTGPLNITISVGIADLTLDDKTIEELLSRADAGLYKAKTSGRNQIAHQNAS